MRPEKGITVIGAGLAGCEAAAQAARLGVPVTLIEMKPEKKTPAHKSDKFCELVCSNSLRSAEVTNAAGLLKEELRRLGSLVIEACDKTRVSAGGALAVDRELFSGYVTERVRNHPLIRVESREVTGIPEDGITVVATGPLTSDALAADIVRYRGAGGLWFYDAAAPIVSFDSVDMSRAFFASRYGKGTPDYINCPMTEEEYRAFYRELINAETAELHEFEKSDLRVFEGCMPVEVMARRGEDTLRFGPMKPVGIKHPETGETYYAVVQLRRENEDGTMFNLVGFQTHLTFTEQRRVFGMIPGLENAEFLRYGGMHRNTFLNSPGFLAPDYSVADDGRLFFAGQMTGVEGYVESAASGLLVGAETARRLRGLPPLDFPQETAIGALALYVSNVSVTAFQPMNVNFGILPPLEKRVRGKKFKNEAISARSLAMIDEIRTVLESDCDS